VRRAAGDRLDTLRLNVLVQHVAITTRRDEVLEQVADYTHDDPEILAKAPYLLIGTVDQIVEQIHHARQRWGFSYFATRDAEATGAVIAALGG